MQLVQFDDFGVVCKVVKYHQLLIGICVTDCMFMPGIRLEV